MPFGKGARSIVIGEKAETDILTTRGTQGPACLPMKIRPVRADAIAEALKVNVRELTGEDPDEAEIRVLTRGLRNMDPVQRGNLIRLMMPFVLQYQKEEEDPDDGNPSA